jgi:hypothetical protein
MDEEDTYRGIVDDKARNWDTSHVDPDLPVPQPGQLIQTLAPHLLVKKSITANGSVYYQEQRQTRGSFMLCVGRHQYMWNGEIVNIVFHPNDWRLVKHEV